MLYLLHSLAGELCVWVKVLLMILARNQPKHVQNNRDSAPLTNACTHIYNSTITSFYHIRTRERAKYESV